MLFLRSFAVFSLLFSSLGFAAQPESEPVVRDDTEFVESIERLTEQDQETVFRDLVRFIGYADAVVIFEFGQLEEIVATRGVDALTIHQIFKRGMLRTRCELIHVIKIEEFRNLENYWDGR